MPDTVTPCQAALWFASQAFPVLPRHSVTEALACTCGDGECRSEGKHPFAPHAPHGLKDAIVDLDVIRGWFREHYWLNYGVSTEALLVIDIDPRNGGDKTWAAMSMQPTRAVPHTWRVRTGGGGEHLIFANTLGIRCGDLDRGIEIKAKGGYIVGPCCRHKSGRMYVWQPQCSPKDAPLADPPAWLAGLIGNRTYLGKPIPPHEWGKFLQQRFVEGERRKALLRIAGKLATVPGNCSQIARELLLGWNIAKCDPPLPEGELIAAVEDIFTREQAKHKWLKVDDYV
jgi:Bifunctional DNA primase/polymerase, N-terminal